MNLWTQMSIEFATQKNYLDELYKIYPISPNLRRELDDSLLYDIKEAYNAQNNEKLIRNLLKLDLFPVKDSYIGYFREDNTALSRNPQTVNRIAGYLYEMGFDMMMEKCAEPKETNRQLGPMFKHWIDKGTLGVKIYKNVQDFLSDKTENAILNVSDEEMKRFASAYLGYHREKGLDFIARFNQKYVIGETKFLTSFGGHQNAQFSDAVSTITSKFFANQLNTEVIPIAIMDGVLYIKGKKKKNKMYRYLETHEEQIIISGLLLREFLYSI